MNGREVKTRERRQRIEGNTVDSRQLAVGRVGIGQLYYAVARWHDHLRGLATAIHEISGLDNLFYFFLELFVQLSTT